MFHSSRKFPVSHTLFRQFLTFQGQSYFNFFFLNHRVFCIFLYSIWSSCKEIKPVSPKGNQSWVFIGRTDAETEAPTLWPLDGKNWHIGKHLDSGKDWRQEEKGITEDEMVGWHHRLDEHESEQALGVWWWTGRPGVLQSMGLQIVGHDWVTEMNWTVN